MGRPALPIPEPLPPALRAVRASVVYRDKCVLGSDSSTNLQDRVLAPGQPPIRPD